MSLPNHQTTKPQSAFWHRFAATAHSPIGLKPQDYGVSLVNPIVPQTCMSSGLVAKQFTQDVKGGNLNRQENEGSPLFAQNEVEFTDPTGCDHDALGDGLRKAIYNYMHGVGLDTDVREWFEGLRVPKTLVRKQFVRDALVASWSGEEDAKDSPEEPGRSELEEWGRLPRGGRRRPGGSARAGRRKKREASA